MSNVPNHITVLLSEAVDALLTNVSGQYIDGTFGRGGHSQLILDQLESDGMLLAVDKDPAAILVGEALAESDQRFSIVHGSFADIDAFASDQGWTGVDGVLVDLGVSSPQLDEAGRGFSFMQDGPLDMRMDSSAGESAAQWISRVEEHELARVLKEYGEERFAKRIAAAIVAQREQSPITTTSQLSKIVSEANPAWEKNKHPATRAFQAIRIEINKELEDLEVLLEKASRLLKVGGRLVVISFHSLEDRMVKRAMKRLARGDEPPAGVPVFESDIKRPFKAFNKAIKPSRKEVEHNPRARSAVMRILERLSDD